LDWYEGANSNTGGLVKVQGKRWKLHACSVHSPDGKPYKAAYRAYKTPEDGFKDMARIILGGGKRKAAVPLR